MRRIPSEFAYIPGESQRGFTLIELVLVVLLLGIIAGVFGRSFQYGNLMFDAVEDKKELTQETRATILRIVREVRQVRSASDVLTASTLQFSFYGIDDSLYTIEFSGTPGGNLTLRRGSQTQTIAADVDSLAFEYLKSDGTAAAPLVSPNQTDIWRVNVFLRLARGARKVAVKTGTYLRNV